MSLGGMRGIAALAAAALGAAAVASAAHADPPLVPEPVTAEAQGPDGAVVTYTADPRLACSPASGSTFSVGVTTVTCTNVDDAEEEEPRSFTVTVVDTTPPSLTAPAGITVAATSAGGIASSDPAVTAFVASATATDLVTTSPSITSDIPATLPIGVTTVTFTATDAAGNRASQTSTVTVTPAATPPPPPPAPETPPPPVTAPATPPATPPDAPARVDRVPPRNVANVNARPQPATVTLTWTLPADEDFSHVRVLRAPAGDAPATATLVYEGPASTVRDTRLRNGVTYRYLIVSYDTSGNRSPGVAVLVRPRAVLLRAPANGRRVTAPPLLVWAKVARATYYNVQLFRNGRKVLTAWPRTNRLKLRASWRVGGTRQRLAPGTYRWYVWPGLGPRDAGRYGPSLGSSTFVVVRR